MIKTVIITGTVIGRVEAIDHDSNPEFRRVQYFTNEDDDDDFPGFFFSPECFYDCFIIMRRVLTTL